MAQDVIIIGGGVIGCSIALKLAEAGLKVTLMERGRAGCEASRAAAGMLSPQSEAHKQSPFLALCLYSRSIYPSFADHLAELSGIDVEYRDEGLLYVELEGDDPKEVERWFNWQTAGGLKLERIPKTKLRMDEPAVTETATGAVFIPGDHQVDNRKLMDAVALAARRAGVDMIEGVEVSRLTVERDRVIGVRCGEDKIEAGAVVVAAGCWSGGLLDPLGLNIKTIPARGQMIALKSDTSPLNRVLHSRHCYLVPRRDGRILVGSTVEYTGFTKGVTAGGVGSLIAAAVELVPSLNDFEIVESWSGLRPDTADHLPVMGETGIKNLFVASGHFRNGILLAPATAEFMSELIVTGRAPEELQPFGVERLLKGSEGA
ncbi:MAG TPA: glycine oxidase ThiO [Blastocatellia bacterium]|nr:glycine oxidase ThiO [Blastocatellia bacterium]